jgi:hypothetical protein
MKQDNNARPYNCHHFVTTEVPPGCEHTGQEFTSCVVYDFTAFGMYIGLVPPCVPHLHTDHHK